APHSAMESRAPPKPAIRNPLCTEPPPKLSELALDRRAAFRHLLVGEGPVRRSKIEPQRQRLLPPPNLLASVHVEHRAALEQLAAALGPRGLHLGGEHLVVHH